LRLIVNNLRFLILPWVRCANLASKVLARCGRQLPEDFAARYGDAPVFNTPYIYVTVTLYLAPLQGASPRVFRSQG
jgi:hypothetical protein